MVNTNALSAKDWYDRGNEIKRSGDFSGALDAFKQSINLNPKAAAPWIGLAQLLDKNTQFEDARQCLLRAVAAEPNHLVSRQMLAASHQKLGYTKEAEREYKIAIKLDPSAYLSYLGLGQLFEDIGEPEKAAKAYRYSRVCAPNKQDALASILELGKYVDISDEIEQAQDILASLENREKALVGYGLGKAYEQQKQYDRAFSSFNTANKARKDDAGAFNRIAFDKRISSLIHLFSSEFFATRKDWGVTSKQPLFIVGLPRSGTTLTEQILASHPDCFGAGELNALSDLATGTPDRLDDNSVSWPETASLLSNSHIESLAKEYLSESAIRAPASARIVIDKQPLNFWHLGLITIAFPNAKIVHCTRDIRDCGLSIFTQNFNTTQSWSTDLDDIAYYWLGYQKLIKHFQKVSGLKILEMNYEETVTDIDKQAKKLLEFVGLEWDERVLNFHQSDRAVQTPSRWQVRQPLYQSAKARWKNYEQHLTPLIEAESKNV